MSYNGSGVYSLPGAALANGETVSASEHNTFRNDVATAFNVAWTRDGQSSASADIPMNSHKFTGLAAGSATGDSLEFGQIGTDIQAYMAAASKAEMEAGTESGLRSMSPLRVAEAIAALASASVFPSGTLMLFQQTAAPTGWTKQTTHNDKALRVVSGTAGSGGSTAFTSVFASRTPAGSVGATTLNTTQIPSHTHTVPEYNQGAGGGAATWLANTPTTGTYTTSSSGGGGSHTHSFTGTAMDFAVQYVDLIIASKD